MIRRQRHNIVCSRPHAVSPGRYFVSGVAIICGKAGAPSNHSLRCPAARLVESPIGLSAATCGLAQVRWSSPGRLNSSASARTGAECSTASGAPTHKIWPYPFTSSRLRVLSAAAEAPYTLLGLLGLLLVLLPACTIHPTGEQALRRQAAAAGKPFQKPYAQRHLPPLPLDATAPQLIEYAVLNNPGVEEAYWKWRAAIEEIPQAGTQAATLMLTAGTTLQNGQAALANTILGAGDTIYNIRWPSKLSVQARAALQAARAAGWRYRAKIFAVRRAVLFAWYDYANTAVQLRLTRAMKRLLEMEAALLRAGVGAGGQPPRQLLALQNRIDNHRVEIVQFVHQLKFELAGLNALLGRPAAAPLTPPSTIPVTRSPALSERGFLILAMQRNPALRGLRRLVSAGRLDIHRAQMQYLPNFDLGFSTSLDGAVQNFTGDLVAPWLRYQAINASIAQTQNQLRSIQAALRREKVNLAARLLIDLIALRNDHRQIILFAQHIQPRLKEIAALDRADYQQGRGGVESQLETEHMLLDTRQTIADLRTDQGQRIADLDAIIAAPLERAGGR